LRWVSALESYPGPSQAPSRRPGGPLRWVSALESYPGPSQAIKETWRALEVGVSPGELPRPLSSHQGDLDGVVPLVPSNGSNTKRLVLRIP